MERFEYRAYGEGGKLNRGELEACSHVEALQQLRARGLVAFSLVSVSAAPRANFWILDLAGRGKSVTARSRLAFVYELGILLRAQMPIDQALRWLPEQPDLKGAAAIVRSIAEAVAGGKTLGEALAVHTNFLQEHETAMIRAAEHGGSAAEVLLQLAQTLRRQMELRSRIKAALTYPAILLIMSLFTVLVISAVLIPNLLPLFDGPQAEAPFIIKAFLALNANSHMLLAGFLVIAGTTAIMLRRIRSNENLALRQDRLMLKLPIIGSLIEQAEAARIGSSLGLLLKSGMPMLQALDIARKAVKNRVIEAAMKAAIEKVASGKRLAKAFAECSVMPPASCHLAAVGEEANRLDELLMHIAQMNETAVQYRLERLVNLLTPILTLAMGVLVAGLITAVMRAILSVNDLVLR